MSGAATNQNERDHHGSTTMRRPTAAVQQRTRANAFDAARSGSWHYYSPVPRRSHTEVTSPMTRTSQVVANENVSARTPQSTFDAANPATWPRTARSVTPVQPQTERVYPATSIVHTRQDTRADIQNPRTLQDWQAYLSSAGVVGTERQAILTDVMLAMRQANQASSSQTPTPRATSPSTIDFGPRATSPFASILDDPDFGDTSAYWNAVQTGRSISTPRQTRAQFQHNTRLVQPSTIRSTVQTVQPQLPRQPTHLNHPGLAPEVRTVRRAPSISSFASNGTLPEYRVEFEDRHSFVLPDYQSRASFEVEV